MRKIIIIIIMIFLLIIENTILPYYSFNGSFPSLVFVFAIAYSIINGKWEAIFIGCVSGFLQDIFFIDVFGINMLVNMLLCVLVAYVSEGTFKSHKAIPVMMSFIVSIIKVFIITMFALIFDKHIRFISAIISSFMNVIVMFIIYNPILFISKKYLIKDQWRFR